MYVLAPLILFFLKRSLSQLFRFEICVLLLGEFADVVAFYRLWLKVCGDTILSRIARWQLLPDLVCYVCVVSCGWEPSCAGSVRAIPRSGKISIQARVALRLLAVALLASIHDC